MTATQTIGEALTSIFQGIARLHAAFPSRAFTIDGRLVGDVGEVLAELEYDLTLDEVSAPDHDARMRDGRRVQIRAICHWVLRRRWWWGRSPVQLQPQREG